MKLFQSLRSEDCLFPGRIFWLLDVTVSTGKSAFMREEKIGQVEAFAGTFNYGSELKELFEE